MPKILIIEDESALQKSLGDMLNKQGYEIFKALDGEIGLNLAQKELPNLIILDLILPKMNGFDVLKQIKSSPETQHIPVVILTNLDTVQDIEKALEEGASTYLVKSNYTLQEVLDKIKQIFEE